MNSAPANKLNPWPVAIVVYFVVFITFIVSFIVFAARQKVDLVRTDYYEEEVRFQQQLDRVERTAPVKAEVAIAYDPRAQVITITLPSAHASRSATGCIQLYRPSDASLDQSAELAASAAGVQQLDTRTLRTGLWKVRVCWKVDGREYFHDQSIVIGSHPS